MCAICRDFDGEEHACLNHHGWVTGDWCARCRANWEAFAAAMTRRDWPAERCRRRYAELVRDQVARQAQEQLVFPFETDGDPTQASAADVVAALRHRRCWSLDVLEHPPAN